MMVWIINYRLSTKDNNIWLALWHCKYINNNLQRFLLFITMTEHFIFINMLDPLSSQPNYILIPKIQWIFQYIDIFAIINDLRLLAYSRNRNTTVMPTLRTILRIFLSYFFSVFLDGFNSLFWVIFLFIYYFTMCLYCCLNTNANT